MELISTDESYADRRQLFKNIWDTAMVFDEKDPDILNKPKVIKTLRLDDEEKGVGVAGKKKKERIKNLRTVCNKILDFCDRQDADDMFYEQMTGGQDPDPQKVGLKPKKLKTTRGKKKISRAKSLNTPFNTSAVPHPEGTSQIKPVTSERKDNQTTKTHLRLSKTTSPLKYNRTSVIRRALVTSFKPTNNSGIIGDDKNRSKTVLPRRKIVRKKRSKRKKPSQDSSGSIDGPEEWDKLLNQKLKEK